MILSLDKITRLLFSYARARLKSSGPPRHRFQGDSDSQRTEGGSRILPAGIRSGLCSVGAMQTRPAVETAENIAPQLLEAEKTLQDLAGADAEPENQPHKAATRRKPSLFVADAFSNPKHLQFAIKVTLAGMLGYLFYTASDYYGIHTVFYTPLIIALASTGATIHKGFLRVVGCMIGGALGLICSIWVIPRFETLATFLFIVFCVHGLAAWIAVWQRSDLLHGSSDSAGF